jgi:hypothetical protein
MNNSCYVRDGGSILRVEVLNILPIYLLNASCVSIVYFEFVSAVVHTASTVRNLYILVLYIHDVYHLTIANGHQHHDAHVRTQQ